MCRLNMHNDDSDKNRAHIVDVIDASDDTVTNDDSSVSDDNEKEEINKVSESVPDDDDELIFVPRNPRTWNQKHIETWIKWASNKFNLTPALDISRFPKDAIELATYSKADFYIICGSFEGGKRVSQHYKYLMQNANEIVDLTLLTDDDPGGFVDNARPFFCLICDVNYAIFLFISCCCYSLGISKAARDVT